MNDMIGPLLIGRKVCMQEIGKKEQLQNGKHNKQLYENNLPQSFTDGHSGETLQIKSIDFQKVRRHNIFPSIHRNCSPGTTKCPHNPKTCKRSAIYPDKRFLNLSSQLFLNHNKHTPRKGKHDR
jgi:hypothetical protein